MATRNAGIQCLVVLALAASIACRCLVDRPPVQYKRHLFYHGASIPIVLENSMRRSHDITNHILKVLLEEVVGYEKVEIRTKDTMDAAAIMNRISGCPVTGCGDKAPDSGPPETMVNTEVWMMAGFSRVPWTNKGNVIDLGPLGPFGSYTFVTDSACGSRVPWTNKSNVIDLGSVGPFGRLGWFMPSKTVDRLWEDNIIADHWRALNLPAVIRNFTLAQQIMKIKNLTHTGDRYFCNLPECIDGIYYGSKCSPTNMYTCATLLASYPDMDMGVLQTQVHNLSLPVNIAWLGPNLDSFVQHRTARQLPVLFFNMDMGVLKTQVHNLNLPVNIAWLGPNLDSFVQHRTARQLPVLFFSWEPNVLTAEKQFTRIKFPLCQNDLTALPRNCDFGLNQFTKIVWSKVKTNIPEAYHVISKMTFHQDEYINLLKKFREFSSAYDIACDWVKTHEKVWKKWLPENLTNKTKIYIGGLFPMTGSYWMEPGLVQGGELALDLINESPAVLPEHQLEMIVANSECLPDVSMKAFIKFITNTSVTISGILGPGCSDEAEPIAALSRHFNMLVVSYGAEASSLSDRQKYPYFYRTIPQVDHHKFVYESFFKAMEWRQIGAISEGGQEFPEYHHLLQEHLQQSGISVVVRRQVVRKYNLEQLDVSQIFADLRAQNVRVIIADFFVFAARAVMCEAWRQRMTAHEGYVWFLPSWYSREWWDVDYYNSPPSPGDSRPQEHIPCTTDNMEYAINGHFILQKTFSDPEDTPVVGGITVGQYKKLYARRVGTADLDGTPFASYVYDAVWVYAKALDRVLRRHPGALENIHSSENTELFVDEINKTNFQGVSGRIQFPGGGGDRPGTISVLQYFLNETRLVGRYKPGEAEGQKGSLDIFTSKLGWLTPGGVKPSDGNPEHDECLIEGFRVLFKVSCEMAIVIANILALLTLVLILSGIIIFFKLRYDKKVKATQQRMKELGLLSNDFNPCFSLDAWEISRDDLVLNRKLGEGAFGTVYGGEAQIDDDGWVAVAVKTLKVGSTVQEKVDFLSEAELMKRFSHHNIVSLLGVCTREEPVYAIMEYLLHGDLKTYLLSRRNLVGSCAKESEDVSPQKLTQMALDVAHGLRYLHDLKYVHRDLACRNCMVHSNATVKIGDFGMTRPICDTDYYRFNKKGMLPVRWMSPESLSDGLFTTKSDVWSYGILIYEIVTFGSFPYQGLSNSQVLEYVKNNGRLNLPRNCSEELCKFIYSCMDVELSNRPDMDDVIDDLTKCTDLLEPCLNAPTTSVVIDDTDAFEISPSSCQNTVTQSTSAKFANVINRRSFYSSTSQEKLNNLNPKRFSGGTPVINFSPTKLVVKNLKPGARQRRNSLGSPLDYHCGVYQDGIKSVSPPRIRKDKYKRYSQEIPHASSYNKYIPLLSNTNYYGEPSSDYYSTSENSKELCQNVTSV